MALSTPSNVEPAILDYPPAGPRMVLGQHGMQPSYAVEYGPEPSPHDQELDTPFVAPACFQGIYGSMMSCLGCVFGTCGSIPGCICCPNPYKQVAQGYVGMVSRFGKFYKSVDPGLTRINPMTESMHKLDIKIQIAEIPKQAIMTKDNVNVQIDSVLYWHIIDPYQALYGVTDVKKALIERTQTTLRHILGARVLQDCIENREAISFEIAEVIEPAAKTWGIKVESILIKDIQFSRELQESLSSAAQQKRIGESKVIAAQAEVQAAQLMREAANVLATPAAMQLRYLETMTQMAKQSGTRVIFMPYTPENGGSSRFGVQDAMVYGQMAQE